MTSRKDDTTTATTNTTTTTTSTSLPTPLNPHTHLQYHCLTHSTGLSPNSHVTVAIRKLYCSLTTSFSTSSSNTARLTYGSHYRISVTLTELAGLPRHPIPRSTTESTPLVRSEESVTGTISPRMSLTHSCSWDPQEKNQQQQKDRDNILVLPVRYKDLARDAMIWIQVLNSRGEIVAEAFCALWDERGRLKMGLEAVPLSMPKESNGGGGGNENETKEAREEESTEEEEEDEHWQACRILDQLDQLEQRKLRQPIPSSTTNATSKPSTTASPIGLRSLGSRRFKGGGNSSSSSSKNTSSVVDGSGISEGVYSSSLSGFVGSGTPAASWLDAMTRERCLEILQEPTAGRIAEVEATSPTKADTDRHRSPHHHHHWKNHYPPYHVPHTSLPTTKAYLVLELPSCELPILYEENLYNSAVHGASGSVQALELSLYHHEKQRILSSSSKNNKNEDHATNYEYDEPLFLPMPNPLHPQDELPKLGLGLVQVLDQESPNDNPVEDKYRTLQHHLLRGLVDPALKPNLVEKSRLNVIIGGTSQHLTVEEKGRQMDLFCFCV